MKVVVIKEISAIIFDLVNTFINTKYHLQNYKKQQEWLLWLQKILQKRIHLN